TVLRTADAAGADGVIFSDASVDPYNSKCVRATAGSLFHLPLVVDVPVAEAGGAVRGGGLRGPGGGGRAGRTPGAGRPGGRGGRAAGGLWGRGGGGLPAAVLARAEEGSAVPIYGRAESLILAAAAAVCLYAPAHARRAGGVTPAPTGRVPQEQ